MDDLYFPQMQITRFEIEIFDRFHEHQKIVQFRSGFHFKVQGPSSVPMLCCHFVTDDGQDRISFVPVDDPESPTAMCLATQEVITHALCTAKLMVPVIT